MREENLAVAELGEGFAAPALREPQRLSGAVNPSWLYEVDPYVDPVCPEAIRNLLSEPFGASVERVTTNLLDRVIDPKPEIIAHALELDLARLQHLIQRHTIRLADFVTWVQIREAKGLLQHSRSPILVVAQRTGFRSQERLSRHFRRHVGLTPAKYRTLFAPPLPTTCSAACTTRVSAAEPLRQDLRVLVDRIAGKYDCRNFGCAWLTVEEVRACCLVDLLQPVSVPGDWTEIWQRIFLRILRRGVLGTVAELGGRDMSERTFLRFWAQRISLSPGLFLQLLRLRLVETLTSRGVTAAAAAESCGYSSVSYYYTHRRKLAPLRAQMATAPR